MHATSLRKLPAFGSASCDQLAFELANGGHHVKQQLAMCRRVERRVVEHLEARASLADLVRDISRSRVLRAEAIELGNDHHVAGF
jgi:hypothetical protein